MASPTKDAYYIPHKAQWPIFGSIGLFTLLAGFANYLNGASYGSTMMIVGVGIMLTMLVGWFGTVISESESGIFNEQVDMSFRWGMGWFIFSEVMFFAAFFGALYYTRVLSESWLAGDPSFSYGATKQLLWEGFTAAWPNNGPAHVGGLEDGKFEPMGAWGLPAINTLILLSSGATVTWAHWGLLAENRSQLIKGLIATVILGFSFVLLQATEYHEAYSEMGLTLGTGIYGSTFFMLTGFHGLHVTIGAIFLSVVLFRSARGHFTAKHHFAFEAAAWYWHFVDVVWLGLFIFVYWL
jgi:cytochrome c oxidase subunit 3